MRVVQTRIGSETAGGFKKLYNEKIIPALERLQGCYWATLIKSDEQEDEYLSMTLWDTQEHAEAYEQSGVFEKLLTDARPFLADSSEWKMQLTEDFDLEYKQVEEEPVVTSYPVVDQSRAKEGQESTPMQLRVVSLKLKPGKVDEFKKLYREIIIPALESVKGCRYAYLTESRQEPNHLFSVTVWDSKQAAEDYEHGGLFDQLTEKVQHTFSELFHWKMALEHDYERVVTTDDLRVNHYTVVTAKNFQ